MLYCCVRQNKGAWGSYHGQTSSALLLFKKVGHNLQARMHISQAAEYECSEWLVRLLMTVTPTSALCM